MSGVPGCAITWAGIAAADVDGDGRADILLVNSNGTGIDLYVIRNTTPVSTRPPTLDEILPDTGGNSGTLSAVEIVGTDFPADAQVKLVGPGATIIPTSIAESAAGNLITVNLDLNGATPGRVTHSYLRMLTATCC